MHLPVHWCNLEPQITCHDAPLKPGYCFCGKPDFQGIWLAHTASHMPQSWRPTKAEHAQSTLHFVLQIVDINALPDPCPLPHTVKKRGLNDKERLLYAPMADVGGLLYDKDAVYIDIPDWKVCCLPD